MSIWACAGWSRLAPDATAAERASSVALRALQEAQAAESQRAEEKRARALMCKWANCVDQEATTDEEYDSDDENVVVSNLA